jgi:hypothetical protein
MLLTNLCTKKATSGKLGSWRGVFDFVQSALGDRGGMMFAQPVIGHLFNLTLRLGGTIS